MVRKINWSKRSFKDLGDIYAFIAKDSTQYARITIESIQDAASRLADFPLSGRVLPEFPHTPYREVIVGSYRVIYRYDEDNDIVYMLAVVHGSRLLNKNIVGLK